jgi:hypothetical protein
MQSPNRNNRRVPSPGKRQAVDNANCNNIKSHIDKIVMMYNRKPDIIIVDYLTLLLPNNKKSDSIMFEKYKDVAEELRALTYHFSCPLVLLMNPTALSFPSIT